jgi:uncharacterized protein YdeI (YjbR/CyaY-like superfamily)
VSPIERPTRDEVTIFSSAADFRSWLEANRDRVDALFIGFYKKGVDIDAITYPEAVDEALCFGWIDGITFRVDDEVRAVRFTPRRRTSVWSAINIAKIAELRAAGRMHPSGIRAFEERDPRKDQRYSYERPQQDFPDEWLDRFRADARAWDFWERQSPSFRNMATNWVLSAVKPETRERRFATLLEESRAGRRPRPFRIGRD